MFNMIHRKYPIIPLQPNMSPVSKIPPAPTNMKQSIWEISPTPCHKTQEHLFLKSLVVCMNNFQEKTFWWDAF